MASIHSTPSLAASLETAASSVEVDSPFAQSYTYGYGDYDFTARPLPPRHNPHFSTSASQARGVDLVTPHCAPHRTAVAVTLLEPSFQGGLWEKQALSGNTAPMKVTEGLGALFGKSIE